MFCKGILCPGQDEGARMNLSIVAFALGTAFVMGFALNQGTTCAVSAAREWIDHRTARMATGFAVAVAVAGLTWLPLAWLGGAVTLSGGVPITASLILGAVLLGSGALVNDACLLGTLSRIGHGEVRFLALPAGLALGFAIADWLVPARVTLPLENGLGMPTLAGGIVVLAFVAVIGFGIRAMRRGGDQGDFRHWPMWSAMMVLGLTGATLFALAPGWTYADFVHRGVSFRGGMNAMAGLAAISAALAMVTGAVCAGLVARTFNYRAPDARGVLRSVAGGTIMAIGIVLVPGGNDAVLLAELPVLTTSGLIGFTIMSGTVTGLLWLQRAWHQRHTRQPAA